MPNVDRTPKARRQPLISPSHCFGIVGSPPLWTIVGHFTRTAPARHASAHSYPFRMYPSGVATTAKWVLVVDDDEDNRDSVVEMLQGAGYIAT